MMDDTDIPGNINPYLLNVLPDDRPYFRRDYLRLVFGVEDDDPVTLEKKYYIAPFIENPVLDQIPEIKNTYEYFIMYRIKKDPDHPVPKKEHRFVPCRYANLEPAGYFPGPNINQGWQKTDDGLFKRLYSPGGLDIQGMRIKDNTLYLEREGSYPDQMIKVITVPEDIKKPAREKWLKGVAYTLTDDPDNIEQYVTRPQVDHQVKSEVPA